MDITPNISSNINTIKSYGSKGYEVKEGVFYNSSIFLNAKNVKEVNSFDNFVDLEILDFLDNKTEILLIGTGKIFVEVSENTKGNIKNSFPNIVINEMNSSSVCRTFNILISEGRNVSCILKNINE